MIITKKSMRLGVRWAGHTLDFTLISKRRRDIENTFDSLSSVTDI